MALGLLGRKVGMTQIYDHSGKIHPVTVLEVGPCPVLQIRDAERDGYAAVQLGFLNKERRKATRPERGHVAADLESKRRAARTAAGEAIPPKANCEPQRFIRQFRVDQPGDIRVGAVLTIADVFPSSPLKDENGNEVKDKDGNVVPSYPHVDVVGTSKGRGTTGVMKRHNFKGLRTSHGVKKGSRQRGSISSNASNRGSGRPKKGIRMAGRYGNSRVTSRNLTIVRVDAANNLVLVRGAVPGFNGGFIMIRPTRKKKV